MKKHKLAKQFLKEFSEVPIVSYASKKVGISRNTVYKWRENDPDFRKQMEEAEKLGNDSITDLAQSKLLMYVNKGDPWAIKFLLRSRHKYYAYPRVQEYWDQLLDRKPTNGFKVIVHHAKDEIIVRKNDEDKNSDLT